MPSSVMPASKPCTGRPATVAVSAVGLSKSYGDKTVLDGIDLTVPAGTVFSLLGPNGAGKTTTVKILCTLITADAGDLRVAGHDLATDPQAVRAGIGVTGILARDGGDLLPGQHRAGVERRRLGRKRPARDPGPDGGDEGQQGW